MDFKPCNTCSPVQIVNIDYAVNDLSQLEVYNDCGMMYDLSSISFGYSVDGVCWSCYNDFASTIGLLDGVQSDFYVRLKINGPISKVCIDGQPITQYTTSLDSGFTLAGCDTNSNLYNPYANLDCAMSLYNQLSETVSCMFGIPVYYFKLSPDTNSADLTFKEYTLMNVEAVKQIKIVVSGGTMPSSRPDFTDFGLDFQADWETEVSKQTFATAFGNNAQPMEGDLLYIPMMKRMWMVSNAYDEKKEGFMWNSTTFKLLLTKYQEKGSVDLGDVEDLVGSFVKNKYDDLFGDAGSDNVTFADTTGTGEEFLEAPRYAANYMYAVFESDATRKYVSCKNTDIRNANVYHKGTLISDYCYDFTISEVPVTVVYQKQFCGDDGTCSFLISPSASEYSGRLIQIGNIGIDIVQTATDCTITLMNAPEIKQTIKANTKYLVYLRWSKALNIIEMSAVEYTYPKQIPIYKVQNHHYFFDFDNTSKCVSRYSVEMQQSSAKDVTLGKLNGQITNFKLFCGYNDDVSEIVMMYPTNTSLLINDTARKLVDLSGAALR